MACPYSTQNHIDYASSDFVNTRPCIDLAICSNYIKAVDYIIALGRVLISSSLKEGML